MAAGRGTSSRRGVKSGCALAAVITVLVVVLLAGNTKTVRDIVVQGNERYTAEEIERLSGIKRGDKLKSLNEAAIAWSLERDNAVELVGVDVEDGRVILSVRERQVCAAVNSAGIVLLIDSDGTILERRNEMPSDGPVRVSGLDLTIDVRGDKLESARNGQMETVRLVLDAMAAQGLSDKMSELDVKDSYNLYMVTKTGLQIILGDNENMSDKMAWTDAVLHDLTAKGITRGVLDVSTGKSAAYADR